MHHPPNRTFTLTRRALLAGAALALAAPAGRAIAQTPTPAGDIDFAARIGALLAAAPATPPPSTCFYADLAGQFTAAGIERPAPNGPHEPPEGLYQATAALPLASRAFNSGLDAEWYPTFGFNPTAVGQTLSLDDAERPLAIFRGGFDPDAVQRALGASGYVEVQRVQGAYFSFGDEPALDTAVGRLTLGTMNQAIVRDDLLVFAGAESQIEDVLAVLAGDAPSMASQDRWAGLVPLFSADIVGMIPVPPATVAFWSGEATPVATVPALVDLAFGVRAGSRSTPLALVGEGTPEATPVGLPPVPSRVEARLRYADADLAAREAEAIPRRWREGESELGDEPFSELMELVDAGVSPIDPRAVAIDFVADAPNRWSQMIFANDLSPFIPAAG